MSYIKAAFLGVHPPYPWLKFLALARGSSQFSTAQGASGDIKWEDIARRVLSKKTLAVKQREGGWLVAGGDEVKEQGRMSQPATPPSAVNTVS